MTRRLELPGAGVLAARSRPEASFGAELAAYRVPAPHYDALLDADRNPRPYWRAFSGFGGGLDAVELDRKQSSIARQIHENAVTYNVLGGPEGHSRPWGLDVLPLIIARPQWERLAAGMRQRARLLNAIAADIYGDQRLLAEGLVPAALVHGHPGFIRACHGVKVPGQLHLQQVAFDVAQGPDGRWWVIGCRTQSPSGSGYALENRITLSRLFPDAFRELRVEVLASFFRRVQQTLLEHAPCEGEAPRIVLLSPGPYSETYFEHAYLARYLGFTLVEGGDLTVRADKVYLKTVTGLQRVHAILRRLDDDYCDPVELRSDSTLGVPGLLQAWRAGEVLVANAFGTGMLESPALAGFLPSACELLLEEALAVPNVATWWCGEQAALEDALPRLQHLVLKPAYPDLRMEPVFFADLDVGMRAQWAQRLREAPEQYVLQEYLPLSHAPVWHQQRLESRAWMLRVFLAADGRGDYEVMAGGLCRIAGAERQVVSGQRGGGSKDTWVLSDAPVERISLLPGKLRREDIVRSRRAVSSRAGEHLFWLGRYAERSENCARLLRAVLVRLPDSEALAPALYRPVVRACVRHGLLREAREAYLGHPHVLELDLVGAMFDRRDSLSLAYNIEQTVRTAGAVRDRLSADNWRLVNQLFQAFALQSDRPIGLAEALELIDKAIVSLVAIGGLEMEHMTRDDGWRFLSIGRYLERLGYVTSTCAEVVTVDETAQPPLLDWLLDLSDSLVTYRARYMRVPEWLAVSDLLLFDRHNPRSAAFQLGKLAKQLRLLPDADLGALVGEVARACAACRVGLDEDGDLFGDGRSLLDFLTYCEALARRTSDVLSLRYFSHVYESTRSTAVL